jgi:hypothetical protein
MWKRLNGLGVAVLVTAAFPAAVYAQDPGANDPSADSPSGAIYEIPLEGAREDAAPARPAGAVSPIRTDNGFSSSSEVPGAPAAGGSDADAGSSDGDASERRPADRGRGGEGRGDTEQGRGGTGRGEGGDGSTVEAMIAPSSQVRAEPSHARSYLLLALGVLVAVGLGVTARRAAHGR